MIYQVYAVYDDAVKAFNTPLFFRAAGEALRSFTAAVNDEKSQLHVAAKDYAFFRLGEYDDASGTMIPLAMPERFVLALEVMEDVFPPGKRLPM